MYIPRSGDKDETANTKAKIQLGVALNLEKRPVGSGVASNSDKEIFPLCTPA